MDPTQKDLRIFLCGDVMSGRGIDQILQHPSSPVLYESFVKDARDYVALAEKANGKILYPVEPSYIWGSALNIWQELKPDLKIINLETSITQSEDPWPGKAIHYRMHPQNIDLLTYAGIHCCTLANNHILDWGYSGLNETLASLKKEDICTAGAGQNSMDAMQPAIFELGFNKRVLVFSAGLPTSGIDSAWAASLNRPGVYYLPNYQADTIEKIRENIKSFRQAEDLVIFSLHWGSNWGYSISDSMRAFAHALIDEVKVDVLFGHSSHHPRPMEIYHQKPILYGCGDFINDYEGIQGHEEYRGDLSLMYFLDFDRETLEFKQCILRPLQIKHFSLQPATEKDSQWLLQKLKMLDNA